MQEISVLSVTKDIKDTVNLVTRPLGSKVREKIIDLMRISDEKVFALDFSGVNFIDYSSADEVVVKLIGRLVNQEIGDRFIFLKSLSSLHKENINAALKINKKYAVLVIEKDNYITVIGNIKGMLQNILINVYNDGVSTAREVSFNTGNEINLSGTKLLELYKQRLIYRKEETLPEGGRQFVYYPLIEGILKI